MINSEQNSVKFFPVLTGDIGGTNSRLEIIQLSKVPPLLPRISKLLLNTFSKRHSLLLSTQI